MPTRTLALKFCFSLMLSFIGSLTANASLAPKQDIHQVGKKISLISLIESKKLQYKQLSSALPSQSLANKNSNSSMTLSELKENYSMRKKALMSYRTGAEKIRAEIELLERIESQRSRYKLSELSSVADWSEALDYLSSIPPDPNAGYKASFLLDIFTLVQARPWLTSFPVLLASYLEFSDVLEPKSPFDFISSVRFEAKYSLQLAALNADQSLKFDQPLGRLTLNAPLKDEVKKIEVEQETLPILITPTEEPLGAQSKNDLGSGILSAFPQKMENTDLSADEGLSIQLHYDKKLAAPAAMEVKKSFK